MLEGYTSRVWIVKSQQPEGPIRRVDPHPRTWHCPVVYNCAKDPELHAIQDPARLGWDPIVTVEQYRIGANAILDLKNRICDAFADYEGIGEFNIVVEGVTDKLYLELAAALHKKHTSENLLLGGVNAVHIHTFDGCRLWGRG